ERRERLFQLGHECRKGTIENRSLGDRHEDHAVRRSAACGPKRFAKAATCPIPGNGAANLAGHGKTGAPRTIRPPPQPNAPRTINAFTWLEARLNFGASGQPLVWGDPPT